MRSVAGASAPGIAMKTASRDIVTPFDSDSSGQALRLPSPPTVRILVVADPGIKFAPEQPAAFGVSRLVDLIRSNADPFVRFEVDLARHGEKKEKLRINHDPQEYEPKFEQFRFKRKSGKRKIIDDYDEIWCFGLAPNGDNANDQDISDSPFALDKDDISALATWMNAGGGLLAMGDHHVLGAAMCSLIPRVGTMRKWTLAQGVPPIGGETRLNTNRPQNERQDPRRTQPPEVIPVVAQSDGVPQPVNWKAYPAWTGNPPERRSLPHPLLCGGSLGVIDILPDHQHEGEVFEDDKVVLTGQYKIRHNSHAEYPTVNGAQPAPEAIAWLSTLKGPPHKHDGGDLAQKCFAAIGAYDGDPVPCGRVVVDSTWHHWFDLNIEGLATAAPDTDYRKVVRYFRNCAVWLARKEQRAMMFSAASLQLLSHPQYFEEFNGRGPEFERGAFAIAALGRLTGAGMVRDWLGLVVQPALHSPGLAPGLAKSVQPLPWQAPVDELARIYAMGAIVNELIDARDNLFRSGARQKTGAAAAAINAAILTGVDIGLAGLAAALRAGAVNHDAVAQALSAVLKTPRQVSPQSPPSAPPAAGSRRGAKARSTKRARPKRSRS